MTSECLDLLSAGSILIPAVISIAKFKKLNFELRVFALFFSFATAIEIASTVMSQCRMNNLWLINVYVLIEGFVLCYLIGKWFETKKLFALSMVIFVVYFIVWCYTTFLVRSIFLFNSKEMSVKSMMMIFLSGYLLIKVSLKDDEPLFQNFKLWMASAMLIYFSVTLIVFSTADFMLDDKYEAMHYSWTIHSIINIIANLLFAYGFVCYYKKTNSSSS